MGQFSRDIVEASSVLFRRAAPQQAGVFTGLNPATYNANDPFVLWVIQTIIIIGFTQLLSLLFARIRQPRVIAEVIGGIILGPTIMGRIPHFTNTIFPQSSLHVLTLTSTVGIVFFLFIIGLEVDILLLKRNARASLAISIAGLAIPLGMGAAIAVPIYHNFVEPSVNYGYFVLFVAVAVGITAFPVLCRILTEIRLLDTTVGVLVLSAGIGNDVTGWILLALTVALVNASTGLTALYVLLTGVGYTLFLLFPVKWAFRWLARRSGSLERGEPTAFMMTVTLILVLISAFFTDIIGIHAIFGGFLAGLVIPKDNGFAISVVEKLEDFVTLLLLPQYFALSGLRTNLGLLNNGITWGYTILICVVAFLAKFVPCSVTAKAFGFTLRESGAVGVLMACKGLVELIVLNVGLQAKILDQRVFSMFVLHAVVLTFITTPLTVLIYPSRHRVHGGMVLEKGLAPGSTAAGITSDNFTRSKFAFVFDGMEQLPSAMTLAQLLQRPVASTRSTAFEKSANDRISFQSETSVLPHKRTISIDAIRLVELTERTSAVLKSQVADTLIRVDPVLSVFRAFGRLNHFSISASLSVISYDEFSTHVADHVRGNGPQMVVIPWPLASLAPEASTNYHTVLSNPLDSNFSGTTDEAASLLLRSQFVRKVFASSPSDVALFIDRGLSTDSSSTIQPHVFLPFFGGPDDRLALSFVIQLCMHEGISATVIRFHRVESDGNESVNSDKSVRQHGDTVAFPNTVYSQQDTQVRIQSDTADNLLWDRVTSSMSSFNAEVHVALARISFRTESAIRPLHRMLELAGSEPSRPLLVVAGRSRRMAIDSHRRELNQLISERNASLPPDVAKTFGDVASAFVVAGGSVSLVVTQATL
ncbi:Sodium/hydrogen exchanger family-domain-containing protein [Lactifluus subvellereus]|nr:Sodium/hydrogen exchanger family-domain-containing protein [Lactifluus subvellereus]